MCTVTYIPQANNSFVLTSNRDEQPGRSPKNISTINGDDIQLVFPRDSGAGGTWIAMSDTDRTVCVLNGAFEAHQMRFDYRMSRGLMVLEFFQYAHADDFFSRFDFKGMEPFTMIICEQGALYELRWDEHKAHVTPLDTAGFHIWSSATLYEKAVRAKRERWFADWLQQKADTSLESILDFHQRAGDGDPWNDVIMDRGFVRTVSITNVIKASDMANMIYNDLIRSQQSQANIALKNYSGLNNR